MSVKLTKPVTVMGKEYTELTFREPRGVDIAECGSPLKGSTTAYEKESKIDARSVTNLIAILADVPIEVAQMICGKDWMEAMVEVMGFFGDTAPKV